MRRMAFVVLAAAALAGAAIVPSRAAAEAGASPFFSIDITKPPTSGGVATVAGFVTVRVHPSGVDEPSNAAYELRQSSESWSEGAKVSMTKVSGGDFEAGFDSNVHPNGTYKLLARAWNSGLQQYDPGDPGTYASDSITVQVNNAPPSPSAPSAYGGKSSASVSWYAVPTSDRSDFAGYRVYRAPAGEGTCPGFYDYSLQETTFSTSHYESGLSPGTYCFVVTSTRSSPVSGTIESPPSPSATAEAESEGSPAPDPSPQPGDPPGSGGGNSEGSPPPQFDIDPDDFIRRGSAPGSRPGPAPDAPGVPVPATTRRDGSYRENLPYGPQQVTQPVAGSAASGTSAAGAAGTDARRQARFLLAWGFLLVGMALVLRAFLTGPRPQQVSRVASEVSPGEDGEAVPVGDSDRRKGRRSRGGKG